MSILIKEKNNLPVLGCSTVLGAAGKLFAVGFSPCSLYNLCASEPALFGFLLWLCTVGLPFASFFEAFLQFIYYFSHFVHSCLYLLRFFVIFLRKSLRYMFLGPVVSVYYATCFQINFLQGLLHTLVRVPAIRS